MYNVSGWQFDQEVTNIFDEHVRQSVPLYRQLQDIVTNLSDFFINTDYPIYDLGCSTGETISKINSRHFNKKLKFIGIDESQSMILKAKEKTQFIDNVDFINTKIEDYIFEKKSNLILSILTLQFCPINRRQDVLLDIYNTLNKGGALILVEKAYPENVESHDIFTQLYHDLKEENGLTPLEIREKDKSLRSRLTPLTLEENIKNLNEIGFKTDVFFKYLNFTGIICFK